MKQDLFIQMVISAWEKENSNLEKLVATFTDDQWMKEIAPGKNTGHYLLGHLIAINDAMLPLLGYAEMLFPGLQEVFVKNPDKSGLMKPSVAELKTCMNAVNAKLFSSIRSTSPEEWFRRHNAVSEEDFAKEPHRNKLNVILNRTAHLANHIGQLLLLK